MKSCVRKQFGRAAQSYNSIASVQHQVSRELIEMLPPNCIGPILEVGCGTGFLTEMLIDRYPGAQVDAVDISAQMIAEAQRKVVSDAVRFCITDIVEFESASRYPLITSSAALQWILPIEDVLSHLRMMLSAEGKIVFSMMTAGTLALLYQIRKELFPLSPGGLELLTEDEVRANISLAQLSLVEAKKQSYFQPLDGKENLFSSLKKIGVTASGQSRGLLSRKQLAHLLEEYQLRCVEHYGVVGIEYEVLYCHLEV